MFCFSLHKEVASSSFLTNRDIEILDRSASHFFLSSQWVRAWLEASGDVVVNVVRVYLNSLQVGFFILGETQKKKFGFNFISWHLFRLGVDKKDQIWVEYNHLPLLLESHQERDLAIEAFLDFTLSKKVDLLNISVAQDMDLWSCIRRHKRTSFFYKNIEASPFSRLSYAYFHDKDNQKRKRIEKKIKKIQSLNPVLIEEKWGREEILLSVAPWHIKKWINTTTPSGFANPDFVNFHSTILRERFCEFSSIRPRVFSLFLSGERVAVLYGFQHLEWFGFYCLIFNPETKNKIRPGIYMHYQLQKKLFQEGVRCYDFMAGADEYKLLLSNQENLFGAFSVQLVDKFSLLSLIAEVKKIINNVRKHKRLLTNLVLKLNVFTSKKRGRK